MQVIAVPVKSLDRAKGRLAPLLAPQERAVLALAMLEDVLRACLAQAGWDVWVVSPDQAVLETAARRGARPLPESGRSLGAAVAQVGALIPGRRDTLAVVLGDLPLLTAGSLGRALSSRAPVVAAPARSDGGTNVLVRRPASIIRARFGRSSFARHQRAARRAGVAFQEVRDAALAFDLDRSEDVADVLTIGSHASLTLAVCQDLGLEARLRVRAGAL